MSDMKPRLVDLDLVEYRVTEDWTYSDDGVKVRCYGVSRQISSHALTFAWYTSLVEAGQVANFLNDRRIWEVQR